MLPLTRWADDSSLITARSWGWRDLGLCVDNTHGRGLQHAVSWIGCSLKREKWRKVMKCCEKQQHLCSNIAKIKKLNEAQTRDLVRTLKKNPKYFSKIWDICMELFSYWAFPCTCPHPTGWAIHTFSCVLLHNPPLFVLVQSLSLSSLSEWFNLKISFTH